MIDRLIVGVGKEGSMLQPEQMLPTAEQQVIYRSLLLRVRQVVGEEESTQQFFVRDIQTEEESYFANLHDVVGFLHALLSAPEDLEA